MGLLPHPDQKYQTIFGKRRQKKGRSWIAVSLVMTLGCQRCELYRNTGTAYLARLRPNTCEFAHPTLITEQLLRASGEQTLVSKVTTTVLGTREGTLYLLWWHCRMGVPCQSPCPEPWTRQLKMKFWTSLLVILPLKNDVSHLLVLFYSSNIVTQKREWLGSE